MPANDTCQTLIASHWASQPTPSLYCKFGDFIYKNQISITNVKTYDCNSAQCRQFLTAFAETNTNAGRCNLTNIGDARNITVQSLGSICDGISITTTVAPYDFFSNYDASSSSSGIIMGASVAVGLIVFLALLTFFCRHYRLRINQSNYPATPFANDANYEQPQGPFVVVSTATTTASTAATTTQPPFAPTALRSTSSSHGSSIKYPNNMAGQLDLCDLDMHKIHPNDVHLLKPLAQGAYGEVWLGEHHGSLVAVKRLLSSRTSLSDLQKFIWEINLLSKIHSPHIVRFVGVSWAKPSDMMLLTEFMDGGDLRQVLEANFTHQAKTKFSWQDKVGVALNIAEGLVFLHSMDPKVVHRDLKSRNVLLDTHFNAKITDFGIARETDDATMTAGIGTYRWIAPEVLLDGHYSESADIFSLGVLLSELSTEVIPYSDLRNGSGNPYTDTAIMAKVMAGQLVPSFLSECPMWFLNLGRECLALNPDDRPTAMMVAYQLRSRVQGFV